MMKHLHKLSVATMAALFSMNALGQPGTVIFHDDFGTGARKKAEYAATGFNAFTYADPTMEYALTGSGNAPAGVWTNSATEWRYTAKGIENNHYAVVAPSRFYEGTGYTQASIPSGFKWPNIAAGAGIRGVDPGSNATGVYVPGDAENAVMVVNAGSTPGILYQRKEQLERGKYYRLTYWLYVETATVRLKTNILDADGIVGLGTSLGPVNGTVGSETAVGKWVMQTKYFHLPATSCTGTEYYTINLQNHNLADGGNDFAIDELRLVEVTATEATGANEVACQNTARPSVNDDTEHFSHTTSTVRVRILDNDRNKSNNVFFEHPGTGSWGDVAEQAELFKFEFIVPAGEGHTVGNLSVESVSVAEGAPTLTIQGEGTWRFKYDEQWGAAAHFYLEFEPASGFVGNPSPIQYTIKEYASSADRATDNGITSNTATVTITFENPSNPVATDDYQLDPNDGTNYKINIFTHGTDTDNINGTPTTGTGSAGAFELEAVHPKNEGAVYSSVDGTGIPTFDVPGEGTWTYSSSTQEFTFVPVAGFTGEASPLPYRFKDPETGVWSNWAYVYIGADGPLPVTLTSFNATLAGNAVLLNWETASEQNNAGFAIEKSNNATTWSTIATVASKAVNGNSTTAIAYAYKDEAVQSGVVYYRLKQTDFDGKFAYSDVVAVRSVATAITAVFPNPAQQHTTVSFATPGKYTVEVLTVNGQTVQQHTVNIANTQQLFTLQRNGAAAGVYLVKVTAANGETTVTKVIFQ